jgi:glycosyltransferase involved in cell wall biosynthesis
MPASSRRSDVRILVLNSVRGGGGGLRSAVELARGLAGAGHDVQVACNRAGALARRLAEIPGAQSHPLRIGPDYDPLATLALARLLRSVRPDVAIADRRKDVNLLVAARALGPHVPIVHRHGAPSALRSGATYRFFWTRIQALVVNSRAMREVLVAGAPWLAALPIEVIPNGVDTARFRPLPERRTEVRHMLGLPPHAFVVAFHGVLQARKRVPLLLRAVAELGPEARVLLVGAGPDAEALAREAEALGVLATFTGLRDDVPDVLAAADAYVHLSAAEGFSNSVLEALACGLPVVASDEHSHREQVTDACGFLVAPRVAAVAAALRRLMGDVPLRKRLADGARVKAQSDFDLGAMVRAYERLLASVCEAPGRPPWQAPHPRA